MSTARVYQKGQVTIPKSVRDSTGIDIGDAVIVEARGDEIVVRRPRGVLEFEPPDTHREVPWHAARRAAREDRVRNRIGTDEP
jgi:AbrB family looped-hinge helix DNA binding protein